MGGGRDMEEEFKATHTRSTLGTLDIRIIVTSPTSIIPVDRSLAVIGISSVGIWSLLWVLPTY